MMCESGLWALVIPLLVPEANTIEGQATEVFCPRLHRHVLCNSTERGARLATDVFDAFVFTVRVLIPVQVWLRRKSVVEGQATRGGTR